MAFVLPEIHESAPFSWGPPGDAEDGLLRSLPFLKTEEIKFIDWYDDMEMQSKEGHYKLVTDDRRIKALENMRAKDAQQRPKQWFDATRNQNPRNRQVNRGRRVGPLLLSETISFPHDAVKVASFELPGLVNMQFHGQIPRAVDIETVGHPPVFNTAVEAASCKKPVLIKKAKYDADHFKRSDTLSDEVFRSILKKEAPGEHPIVVTTDEILALIMSCSRCVHPWHLLFSSYNRMVFISKEDEGNVEKQWVGETVSTAYNQGDEDFATVEAVESLEAECTHASNAFVVSVCQTRQDKSGQKPGKPNKQQRLHRYRRYIMHEGTKNRYDLIVRCEVDAVRNNKYTRLFTLLEEYSHNKPSEWRKMLDSQQSTCVSSEFRNNMFKMSRWVSLCHLSNSMMTIGFVSFLRRAEGGASTDSYDLLSVCTAEHTALNMLFGIEISNLWAVADAIISTFIQNRDRDLYLVKRAGTKSVDFYYADADELDEDDSTDDDEA
ncbi:putative Eukaryotic translation initiation factor 3 subunit 7 (eIF 3) [Trypanosoma vivax]|uniref:Putative eukaryotic translation initiation factor 3 subunit 7-like protein n=1 Tax=Trypanosoma vivax (strain Y486) TaxID=1055687 RepID=G0TX98_TRYVY|nr:putative eukaryotic translation initiation factor 3 subunit 7-like protein [Trypanosoma vivax]KAH8613790.1 putative Eukaryotic translation initiation factor 3 subunit 7 (eIF 3) [Trypanosoma vivax]CCC48588.1 putative eukaryotic translation initiation factor 3 subunit 7-like protein [Trypanosoma vivax Y486]